MKYENLDGVTVTTEEWVDRYLDSKKEQGYTVEVPLRGEVGATELAMHCGIVTRIGIRAWKHHQYSYAYVLLDNGKLTDGSFHLFSNGTFSVA